MIKLTEVVLTGRKDQLQVVKAVTSVVKRVILQEIVRTAEVKTTTEVVIVSFANSQVTSHAIVKTNQLIMRKEVATSVNVETITTRDHIEARMKAGYKVSLTKLAKMLQGRRLSLIHI